IDKGRLTFDGKLESLAQRIRPGKRVVFRLVKPAPASDFEALGKVVRIDAAEAVLQVPRDHVNDVVSRALATLPVSDLTVEDPPLEEIMSELFARGSEKNAAHGEEHE